jgi:hypothetical protein
MSFRTSNSIAPDAWGMRLANRVRLPANASLPVVAVSNRAQPFGRILA